MDRIGEKAVTATKWSFLSQVAGKLISPITTMVLAHLLAPEAFGVVATMTMVVSFADVLSDAGFQKYLIQHEFCNSDQLHRSANVAFWTNIVVSLLLWSVIAFFSSELCVLLGCVGCEYALILSCASLPLTALISVQTALYQRGLDYKILLYSKLTNSILILVVSVAMALLGCDYWSLVTATIVGNIGSAVLLTACSNWKPRIWYSFSHLRDITSYSMWILGDSALIWVSNWAGTFVLATVMTNSYLGMYKTSVTLAVAITGLVTGTINSVIFSSLSRYQNDPEGYAAIFYKIQGWIALLVLPMGVAIILFRDLIIGICLGSQWGEAALFFGLYGFANSIKIVLSNLCSQAYRSKGKPKYSFFVQLIYLCMKIPVLYFSAICGFYAFSVWGALAELLIIPVTAVVARYTIGLSVLKMIRQSLPVFGIAVIAAAISYLVSYFGATMLAYVISVGIYVVVLIVLIAALPSTRNRFFEIAKKLGKKIPN